MSVKLTTFFHFPLNFPDHFLIFHFLGSLHRRTQRNGSYLDWLKVWICTLNLEYLRKIFSVSSSVLKEFIRTSGTSASYFLLRCWKSRSQNDLNASVFQLMVPHTLFPDFIIERIHPTCVRILVYECKKPTKTNAFSKGSLSVDPLTPVQFCRRVGNSWCWASESFSWSDLSSCSVKKRTSICCTVRSRNVSSFLTEMTDFGPVQPILVPRPPFSFSTTSLLRPFCIACFVKSASVVNSLYAFTWKVSCIFVRESGRLRPSGTWDEHFMAKFFPWHFNFVFFAGLPWSCPVHPPTHPTTTPTESRPVTHRAVRQQLDLLPVHRLLLALLVQEAREQTTEALELFLRHLECHKRQVAPNLCNKLLGVAQILSSSMMFNKDVHQGTPGRAKMKNARSKILQWPLVLNTSYIGPVTRMHKIFSHIFSSFRTQKLFVSLVDQKKVVNLVKSKRTTKNSCTHTPRAHLSWTVDLAQNYLC